ncbi:MAG: HAMP domain-containing histidine kinase [Sphingobacteriales bacterium]|nr:MAG: HAMP domain-containing histidine kinase [Sphingobacteriales bacterium]
MSSFITKTWVPVVFTASSVIATARNSAKLEDLKSKETQLVESEKMASLGQLTAGIAHEINNPINFVTSNVNPLKRDVGVLIDMLDQMEALSLEPAAREERIRQIETIKEDADYDYLKTEIDFLLKGISEGASRTAEIVKGLRIFSRLDEDDLKRADVNEGLNSTIVIVNHLLNNVVEVEKNYGDIPMIECYPGKLNQVFLNMMSNAIHAIHKRWKGEPGGKLTIETHNGPTNVRIVIKDNGTGMDEVAKKKLFEPFFTTKDVGEGTGLGLSIAYNTVRKHAGTIEVISALGEGTEFIITLPINQ